MSTKTKGNHPRKLGRMVEKYWRNKNKGQFAVYTKEGKRFVVPICYLNHPIFRVLLEMAEEEYGLTVDGPLQIPCEKEFMEYILNLVKKHPPLEMDKALPSVASDCKGVSAASLLPPGQAQNQGPIQTPLLSCR
ncbi:hypothetical protein ACH5RR_035304 [Cinchona calisaya]|uniref:Uncharacterized protein n=1 Tax=Cinchona calisaya TaxID=153742 RepID=A0ABD2YEJ7_9GENT